MHVERVVDFILMYFMRYGGLNKTPTLILGVYSATYDSKHYLCTIFIPLHMMRTSRNATFYERTSQFRLVYASFLVQYPQGPKNTSHF